MLIFRVKGNYLINQRVSVGALVVNLIKLSLIVMEFRGLG